MFLKLIAALLLALCVLLVGALAKVLRHNLDQQDLVKSLAGKLELQELQYQQELAILEDQIKSFPAKQEAAIARAMTGARSNLKGTTAEKLYPVLQNCPYDPRDMSFLGDPIDYFVAKGMSDDQVQEIVFLEIKTGKSKRSKRQRQIQEAVEGGRVRFELVKLQDPFGGD